jgi:hypothetical protein
LHRVDHTFRGVVVKPGDREVRFDYAPAEAPVGLGVSATAAAVWCLLLLALGAGTIARRFSRRDAVAAAPPTDDDPALAPSSDDD